MNDMTAAVFNTAITDSDMVITDSAIAQMAELITNGEDDVQAIRVFVSGGGCGGMTYGMTYAEEATKFDKIKTAEGVKLYVDAVALGYLKGCEVDFVNDGVNSSFVFNNVFQSVGGSGGCSACGASGGCGA
ncbi:hypothetical protein MNBD_GAMMA22-1223 [hydrothermal vent metagenome]|uniref:Core domain-containing protein n=1 Tax=hydrothermal vent metagenome TaxID=652676 RepID=A0A3B1AB23_9ZZZZ